MPVEPLEVELLLEVELAAAEELVLAEELELGEALVVVEEAAVEPGCPDELPRDEEVEIDPPELELTVDAVDALEDELLDAGAPVELLADRSRVEPPALEPAIELAAPLLLEPRPPDEEVDALAELDEELLVIP